MDFPHDGALAQHLLNLDEIVFALGHSSIYIKF